MSRSLPIAIVFAKPPRPGTAKTRLAAELGAETAALLARAFLTDTCAALRELPVRLVLATTEEWPAQEFASELWLQGEGTLGERLERMLRRGLEQAPWVMALGADSPGFPLGAITSAERMLASSELVFGPADDGGFYLVAVRSCPEGAFAGVPWSASDTLEHAERRVASLGLGTARIEPWFDVDTLADLRRVDALIAERRVTAPATARALRSIRCWPPRTAAPA